MLPHPYRDHSCTEEIVHQVDFIEIHNSRCTPKENSDAVLLAAGSGKKIIYGSDAHSPEEIGLVKTQVNPESFEVRNIICANKTSDWSLRKSQIISHVRKGEFRTLVTRGTGFLWKKGT